MAKQLQLRKGTSAEHNTFTGANGEVTVDTTFKTLRVHDGVTVGGTMLVNYQHPPALPGATTSTEGIVKLNDTLTSTSTTQALTAAQGKVLKDSLNTAITSSFGVGQTWQDLTSSRASGVTYTNSTGKPIAVSITLTDRGGSNYLVYVNGVLVINIFDYGSAGANHSFFIVPTGASYAISTGNIIRLWAELR
jgi:hypothetical protein